MRIIAIAITVICCILMFMVKRQTKAAIFVFGMMTLTLVNIPFLPLHKVNNIFPLVFLLSEWKHILNFCKEIWKMKTLRHVLIIVCISTIICFLTTSYYNLWSLVKSELLFKYFAIFYAFVAFKDEDSLRIVLKVSVFCLIVLTIFGIINYIDKSAMFVNALTEGRTNIFYDDALLGEVYTKASRFRVQSMFKSPFDYGLICSAMLLLHLHAKFRHLESKRAFEIAIACCIFGILTCMCRIVWVCSVISVAIYLLWSFKLSRNIKIGFATIIFMILAYHVVPAVENKINQITDIFVEESETGGSSIQMRTAQFIAVLYHVKGHEFMGRGKGYFVHDLGWGEGDPVDQDLKGMESVIFIKILEHGYFGLALWATLYFIIFLYFWRKRKDHKLLTGLGMSILSLYVIFAIGTGELGSVYPTMLLLGFVIKAIESDIIKDKIKDNIALQQ